MQQSVLNSLNKYLSKIARDLARISTFREKGCPVDSSLRDTYIDLKEVGDYLKRVQIENITIDEELNIVIEKYENLLEEFESIADQVNSQDEGRVIASDKTLPDFFYRITSRNRIVWKIFERVTAASGVGMIGFSLIGLTYFLAVGNIPFIHFFDGITSAINALVLLVGVILGLCVHEFAHAVVLANNGIEIKRVGIIASSMVGGFVEADETTFFQAAPKVRLRFNAASIGANALLGILLITIGIITSYQLLLFLALGNLFFGFINSFPVSPLDGGWVYEDLVKLYVKNNKVKGIFMSARFAIFLIWIILFIRLVL